MKQAANFAGFGCAAVLLTAMGFIGGLSVGRSSVHRFTKGPSAGIAFDQATGSLCFAGFGKHKASAPACADLAAGKVDVSRVLTAEEAPGIPAPPAGFVLDKPAASASTFTVPLNQLHDPGPGDIFDQVTAKQSVVPASPAAAVPQTLPPDFFDQAPAPAKP